MPSHSKQQRNFIFAKRGKYKTKANTPDKWRWIWEDAWKKIKEDDIDNQFNEYIELGKYKKIFKEEKLEEFFFTITNDKKFIDYIKNLQTKYNQYYKMIQLYPSFDKLEIHILLPDNRTKKLILNLKNNGNVHIDKNELGYEFKFDTLEMKYKDFLIKLTSVLDYCYNKVYNNTSNVLGFLKTRHQYESIKPYKKIYNEDVSIDLSPGDTFLYGKFKNKKGIVKSFKKNERGETIIITSTGAEIPLLKIRLVPKQEETFNKAFDNSNYFDDIEEKIDVDDIKGNNYWSYSTFKNGAI